MPFFLTPLRTAFGLDRTVSVRGRQSVTSALTGTSRLRGLPKGFAYRPSSDKHGSFGA